jgi:hypothetical protein
MNKILDYIRDRFNEKPSLFIGIGVGLILVIIGVALIIRFVDAPLKSGEIYSKVVEPTRVYYEQHRSEVTRTEFYTEPVTHTRTITDSNGHLRTETYTQIETRTRQVFDHWRYSVYKVTDNEDYVITITAPSKKIEGKILYATFYVTSERFESSNHRNNKLFEFNRKLGDRRMDLNNKSDLIKTRDYTPFDMDEYNKEK